MILKIHIGGHGVNIWACLLYEIVNTRTRVKRSNVARGRKNKNARNNLSLSVLSFHFNYIFDRIIIELLPCTFVAITVS